MTMMPPYRQHDVPGSELAEANSQVQVQTVDVDLLLYLLLDMCTHIISDRV